MIGPPILPILKIEVVYEIRSTSTTPKVMAHASRDASSGRLPSNQRILKCYKDLSIQFGVSISQCGKVSRVHLWTLTTTSLLP